MTWSDNPTMDAERYYAQTTANQRAFERENFVGICELCGKPMFLQMYGYMDRVIDDLDYAEGYVHEHCRDRHLEDLEEYEEEFDDQMGNPMDELDNILKVTA